MTYENAVEKIHSLLTFGSRPGLDRMRILLDRLGNPQDRLKFIHIAGTNGKGSVCAMLSSALVAAGYKTGLFISPYITDFRERIQINNCMVSESVLTDAVEKTFPIIEQTAHSCFKNNNVTICICVYKKLKSVDILKFCDDCVLFTQLLDNRESFFNRIRENGLAHQYYKITALCRYHHNRT